MNVTIVMRGWTGWAFAIFLAVSALSALIFDIVLIAAAVSAK